MQHVLVWGDKEQTKPDSCIAIVWAVLRTDEICLHHSFSLPFSMGCRNHSADSISLLFHVRGASPKSLDNLYNHFSIYHVLHYMTAKSNSPVCHHRAPEAQAERRAKSQQGCHFQTTQKHWNALRCIINGSCVLGVSCTWWIMLMVALEACMCIISVLWGAIIGWGPLENTALLFVQPCQNGAVAQQCSIKLQKLKLMCCWLFVFFLLSPFRYFPAKTPWTEQISMLWSILTLSFPLSK